MHAVAGYLLGWPLAWHPRMKQGCDDCALGSADKIPLSRLRTSAASARSDVIV
jgi:hypothetical protein